MIDWFLKRYFYNSADDLSDRQVRVWQKIYAHIKAHSDSKPVSVSATSGFRLAFVPIAVTLLLVSLSVSAAGIFGKVSPEQAYSLLRGATGGTEMSVNANSDEDFDFKFIFQRAEEVIQLENKAKTDGQLTPAEEERIVKAKAEIGQRALALSKISNASVQSNVKAEQSSTIEADELILVEAAEAELVGEAVLQLVRSSVAENGQTDSGQLAKKIKEVVQTIETSEKSGAKSNVNASNSKSSEQQTNQDSSAGKETGNSADVPSVIIEGEVNSGEIQIK